MKMLPTMRTSGCCLVSRFSSNVPVRTDTTQPPDRDHLLTALWDWVAQTSVNQAAADCML